TDSSLWLLLCTLELSWFLSPVCALEVDGAEGGSVTFHLQDLKGEKLGWSFNGDTMLTITLGKSLNPSFFDDSYKSRVTIPDDGSSLTISQLKKKDAGTYTAKNPPSPFPTGVLQEPEVTCVSRNCSAKGCRYVLRCAVHTPEITSFSWSHGEQLDAEEPELVVEEEQPPGELDVLSYTCTVQNPVSSRRICRHPPFPPEAFPSLLNFLGEVTKIRRESSHPQGLAPQRSRSHSPPKALTPMRCAGGHRPSSLEPR
uniref:Ig-like domain-containing protein n=1 Tax=Anas zonorhyncha TaxID=75864 RepID=A0A8B9U0U1_9AVES